MSLLSSFGRRPSAATQKKYHTLPNFSNGQFQNPVPTAQLAEGQTMLSVLREFLFKKHPETTPAITIPSIQTDLNSIPPHEDCLVWFGHSSYFIQLSGKRFLIDPVFSGNASPIPGSVKAFPGSNNYSAADMPAIDLLLISHDHWDHLDYSTVQALQPKTSHVLCGNAVGEHFRHWGWPEEKITEKNWYDTIEPFDGFRITLTPARHFSGRTFKRNTSLFTSFVLEAPSYKLFLGGDSGYAPHFKTIGEQYGPFDLAILECGQYNKNWPYIHSFPEEIITEATELRAKYFMPVHHSKFKLGQHPWYEPLQEVTTHAAATGHHAVTPLIGEKVLLHEMGKQWRKWWEERGKSREAGDKSQESGGGSREINVRLRRRMQTTD